MIQVTQENKIYQGQVAMTVALVSWGMLFATLFLGYFLFRFNAATWPPVEIQDLPKLLPFVSTVIIALSSLCYFNFEKTKKVLFLNLTTFFGVLFLIMQFLLWNQLKSLGIVVSNGMVSSMIYAFSWLHAAHIILGVFALVWVLWATNNKKECSLLIKNTGNFWHFLGVIWLLMYLMFFVL